MSESTSNADRPGSDALTLPTREEAQRRLLAPGRPFELEDADVLGEPMQVYKNRARSLREMLVKATENGDKEYTVFITEDDERRVHTYASIERTAASVAKGLTERYGIGHGDHVAILAANCPEWIATFWACVSLGAVVVAFNGWWTRDEIEYAIELTEPKLLIADRRRLDRFEGDDPGVPTVVVEDDFADQLWNTDLEAPLPDVAIAEDDPATLLFTSGTTGRPKAAVLSHRSLIAFVSTSFFVGALGAMTSPPKEPGDPTGARLVVFPLFHVSGMQAATVAGLASGGRSVWPMGRFDAGRVIEITVRENITAWGGAATHVFRLLEHPDLEDFDVTRITSLGIGGSATTPEIIRASEEKFPHTAGSFSTGYGLTESGALISHADHDMLQRWPDCVGPPLPTVGVRILDDAGNDVPEGEDGNIYCRSPLCMTGYHNNPEANAESILRGRWIKTGDVGRLQDGRLHLASRKRDLILRGGENVYPIEIENRLEGHPGVAEAAVYGVDHRTLGQEVKAVVVPKPGVSLDEAEIKAFCAETLAYYKVPSYVEVRSDPLPRNATGKVMKHVLSGEADNTMVEE